MRRKKKRKATGFWLLATLTAMLCGAVLYATAGVRRERDGNLEEKARLESQIEQLRAESNKLDAKKDYIGTKKFIEEMARKVLGLVYPDEIVFKEKGEGER